MGTFASLEAEHRLFEGLIKRLETGLKREERLARSELRDALLILSPALSMHERIEDTVLDPAICACRRGLGGVAALTALQHEQIESLRKDVAYALERASVADIEHLESLVLELAASLREHFHTEEAKLWPLYRQAASRSVGRSLDRRLRAQVRSLEDEVRARDAAVAEYLERGVH